MNQAPDIVPLSAFSPLTFTFRILERDFIGVAGPLFLAALIGQRGWLFLGVGLLDSTVAVVMLAAAWLPIGSLCTAGMLRFTLKVARGQGYGYRDLWSADASILQLMLLELAVYVGIAASFLALAVFMPREPGEPGSAEDGWFASIPSLAHALGTAGQVAVVLAIAMFWLVALTRTALAAVLIVDERMSVLRALARSVTLTRGNGGAIFLYGILVSMVSGLAGSAFAGAAWSALIVPGIVYVGLAVRGELV